MVILHKKARHFLALKENGCGVWALLFVYILFIILVVIVHVLRRLNKWQKRQSLLPAVPVTMGWAAVQEMLKKPSEINIKMLARKSPKNEEKLKGLMAKPNVKVVWGDLCDYDAILEGVTGADYVLHIGGMVSPTADWKPYRTQKTNIGAAQNICKAVLAQPMQTILKFAISAPLLRPATVTIPSTGAVAAIR